MRVAELISVFLWISSKMKLSGCVILSTTSLVDYQTSVDYKLDRLESSFLQAQSCSHRGTFVYDLKSCQLVRNNQKLLKNLSSTYLPDIYYKWRPPSYIVPVKYQPILDNKYRVLSTAHQLATQRKKRSLDKRRALAKTKELKEKEILSRKRRGIPGNPCTDDISTKTTIFHAVDSETGKVVELLQDPANRLYQTFYTYGCIENRFLSFFCKLQYVEFLTAVYTGVGYKVEVRPVKIPTHCAITIQFS
ncbi:uncharacterized protein LOC143447420 [Clavelina lepadiformis]|uniref:uncharacterized protein LOC143447420 n=1 Tax=Clavelina lepadiformis TaxID=159417 RepID=UPI004042400B